MPSVADRPSHRPDTPAEVFGRAAVAYEQGRPGYPLAAVEWAVGPTPCSVVDVGAGTGKLTTALVAFGADVLAVEPSEPLRQQFTARLPYVRIHPGTAEDLSLPDNSVDIVAVGHAYHWFDAPVAQQEFARVLHPGGRLALLWNLRCENQPWQLEFTRLISGEDGTDHNPLAGMTRVYAGFAPFEQHDVPHTVILTIEELVLLAASRSAVIRLSPMRRAELLDAVRRLALTVAENGQIAMNYVTRCWRTTLVH